MPRPPRIDFPGARHHVVNRGTNHQQIFWNDDSHEIFLDLLGQVVERFGVVVHAFALLPNHFHLMVESARANLSKAMQNLQFRYSQEVNRATGYDGALFRGRFKNRLIADESHWFHLLSYIHLSPVRARLVNRPDRYRWTSHGAYVDEQCGPEWLTTKEMQLYFSKEGGYRAWIQSAMQQGEMVPEDFDSILCAARQGGHQIMMKQPEVNSSISVAHALRQVVSLTGTSEQEILHTQRGAGGNPARALAVWWLVYGAGQTNAQVGRVLNMSSSAVSKVLRKLKEHPSTYLKGQVAQWQLALPNKN